MHTAISMADAETHKKKFDKLCNTYRPLWNKRVKEARDEARERGEEPVTAAITARLAAAAVADNNRLETEISAMMLRTTAIITASALQLAIFGVVISPNVKPHLVVTAFKVLATLVTIACLIGGCIPLAPPLRRAWKEAYELRCYINSLLASDFAIFAWHCWLGDRRTDVLTKYKKSHSVSVRLLVAGQMLIIPTVVLGGLLS